MTAPASVADLIRKVDTLARQLRAIESKQVFSASLKSQLHLLATTYFDDVHAFVRQNPAGSAELDALFQEIHGASRMSASKARCLTLLKSARKALVHAEGESIVLVAQPRSQTLPVDQLIVSTLDEVCPAASLAYQQALLDCADGKRISWRGAAAELREALRETLDSLAPDELVTSAPGFKLETDAKRPTMKQKVRYVLKSRGATSGAMETPESAVAGVEDMVGGLTRSVYTRSSVSTHTPTSRDEVLRIHAWVRLVLCELLELPT